MSNEDKEAELNVAMDHVINRQVEELLRDVGQERFINQVGDDVSLARAINRHERLHEEAARELSQERRDTRMRVLALFVGGILFGASTIGICVIGPTATAWTLPLVSTLGCFAVSLGLVLMGSIKSL